MVFHKFSSFIRKNMVEITVTPNVSSFPAFRGYYISCVKLFQFSIPFLRNVNFLWLKILFPVFFLIFFHFIFPWPFQIRTCTNPAKTSIQVIYLLISMIYSSDRVPKFDFVVHLKMERAHGHFQFCCLLLRCCCYHLNWVTGSYCGYYHCHFHCHWSDLDWDLDPDMLLKKKIHSYTI